MLQHIAGFARIPRKNTQQKALSRFNFQDGLLEILL
jgi:hypothetical protein